MARDLFIRWKSARRGPSREELGFVCEDYLAGIGTVEWREDVGRFICDLPGPPTGALLRIAGSLAHRRTKGLLRDTRWFEVYQGEDYVNVTTRSQDEIVNAIADGLAAILARTWNGEVER